MSKSFHGDEDVGMKASVGLSRSVQAQIDCWTSISLAEPWNLGPEGHGMIGRSLRQVPKKNPPVSRLGCATLRIGSRVRSLSGSH
jgi:hypothetical protein